MDLYELLGMKKVNTTDSHPQTDGLVENVNYTIRPMIAKHAHKFRNDWELGQVPSTVIVCLPHQAP